MPGDAYTGSMNNPLLAGLYKRIQSQYIMNVIQCHI